MITPLGRSVTSIRHRLIGVASARAVTMSSGATPAARAAANPARALPTWWIPCSGNVTGQVEVPSVMVKLGRDAASRVTSTARMSAPGSPAALTVTTWARVRVAMAATAGSSWLSTAVPSGPSASTSSPLASAITSREPNSPRWAAPTLRTTAMSGGAIRVR